MPGCGGAFLVGDRAAAVTETPELFEYEKQIQKVYERLQQCQNRGTNPRKQQERYERMVKEWRQQMESDEEIKQGDFVRTGTDLKLWLVEEVDGECAWIADKQGNEEWLPLSQLEKVNRR